MKYKIIEIPIRGKHWNFLDLLRLFPGIYGEQAQNIALGNSPKKDSNEENIEKNESSYLLKLVQLKQLTDYIPNPNRHKALNWLNQEIQRFSKRDMEV